MASSGVLRPSISLRTKAHHRPSDHRHIPYRLLTKTFDAAPYATTQNSVDGGIEIHDMR